MGQKMCFGIVCITYAVLTKRKIKIFPLYFEKIREIVVLRLCLQLRISKNIIIKII